jgi:hypothetical protein
MINTQVKQVNYMGPTCSKYNLNTDITSKKIKEIKVLGVLNLKPKKRSIYCIEIEFEYGEILNLRVREEYYHQYLSLV